ncbi:MAG: class I SAM-dependent methyltransferase [Pseudomonadales bacterium]|nr:class I SAM-dependent methyltransferase [Pseudomonadales bacterium]
MPKSNQRYQHLESAQAYQEKIEKKRKLSGWLEARMLERSLDDVVGEKVLDCPCGTGRIDPLLRSRFSDITGVDGAAAMFEVYQHGHPERKGQVADIFDLPYSEDEFDWTVCHRLFHHFRSDEDRRTLWNSLARVARNGVSLYCWLDVPFSRRGKPSAPGRQSIPREQFERIVADSALDLKHYYYACWPFSPKVVVTLVKPQ